MPIVNGDVTLLACRWSKLSGAESGPITAIACKMVPRQNGLKYTLVTSPKTNAKTTIWARASGAVLDTSCTIDICAVVITNEGCGPCRACMQAGEGNLSVAVIAQFGVDRPDGTPLLDAKLSADRRQQRYAQGMLLTRKRPMAVAPQMNKAKKQQKTYVPIHDERAVRSRAVTKHSNRGRSPRTCNQSLPPFRQREARR